MSSHPDLAIEATGLVKSFGDTRAVDGVDLAVRARHASTASSAPTAPARRRRSGCSRRCCGPTPASARVLGHDVVREADAVRGAGQPHRPARLGRRGPDRPREPHPARAAARLQAAQAAKARADELLEAFGLAEAAGQQVKNYSGGMRRRLDIAASIVVTPRADVPRRADDRARPALAQPGLGHHPRARRPGHDRAALHPVPRRGRPARRRHRRDRPRQGDRRGHAGPAQGVGRRAARCTCGCSTPSSAPRRERLLAGALGAGAPARPTRRRCRCPCADAGPGGRAPSPSWRAPASPLADFSLGQPSLDEVFLALTGHPAEDETRTRPHERRAAA